MRSAPRSQSTMKGRTLLLIGLGAGALLLAARYLALGYTEMWAPWGIPSMWPPFADLRTITGASETLALGLDPLVQNPGDPWHRVMNYPRVWLVLAARVNPAVTPYLGLALIALFLTGLVLSVPSDLDLRTVAVLLAGALSPAALSAIERGNTDLLIFFLLSVAVAISSNRSSSSSTAGGAFLVMAFVLKLFPVFAMPYFLREDRRGFIRLAILFLAIVAIYCALTYQDLILIHRGTPTGIAPAYGLSVLATWIPSERFPSWGPLARAASYLGAAFALPLAAISLRAGDTFPSTGKMTSAQRRTLDAFRIGSGIYLGTFLLGSNWDYRLVFLLFAIPQLVAMTRAPVARIRCIAATVFVAVLASMWSLAVALPMSTPGPADALLFVMDELANWAVFLGLASLLAAIAPSWLKSAVRFPRATSGRLGATRRAT